MVNNGRTAGCQTCKGRKIKCDETYPECRRCQKLGRRCPGYPDPKKFTFLSQNEIVERKVVLQNSFFNRAAPRVLPRVIFNFEQSSTEYPNMETLTVSQFFEDYIPSQNDGTAPVWLDFLPDLYDHAAENSPLHRAVSAVAFANAASKYNRRDHLIKAMCYYQKALTSISVALQDHEASATDATLVSVLLLALYEGINQFQGDDCLRHVQGLVALAAIQASRLADANGRRLFQLICCQMQRRNLDLRLCPGPEEQLLMSFVQPTSLMNRMIINMFEVSKFIGKVYGNPMRTHENDCKDLEKQTCIDFMRIDQQFRQWNADAMSSMGYKTMDCPINERLSWQAGAYHAYPDTWAAVTWNKHRSLWILLHQSLLEACNIPDLAFGDFQREKLDTIRHNSLLSIRQLAHNMFMNIPFVLGDARPSSGNVCPSSLSGYMTMWDVRVARCPFVSADQRHWATHIMMYITNTFGIGYIPATRSRQLQNELLAASENGTKEAAFEAVPNLCSI